MKITHICLCGPYTDGLNYQENLITKYQIKSGHDVSIVASQFEWDKNGKIAQNENQEYINNDNCRVYRLEIKDGKDVFYRFKHYNKIYETIEKIAPDVIFIHNVQFLDIKQIVKYAKNIDVKIYVDNHADFSNSGKNILSKYILHGIIWKHMAHIIEPYTTRFYGVLPARVDFLKNIYKLPSDKCELLVMGADDELVEKYSDNELKEELRKNVKLNKNDFVIVTGGKIDKFKLQTILLMKAIKNIGNENIKLLIFGSVENEIKPEFDALCDGKRIQYLGWASQEESYKYFSMADLVVFPGRHSVYWEQVASMGIPMVCKYWDGTAHIDIGGNVKFLNEDSVEEIQKVLEEIINDENAYSNMKNNAMKMDKEKFLYSNIADDSIE